MLKGKERRREREEGRKEAGERKGETERNSVMTHISNSEWKMFTGYIDMNR